MNWLVHFLTFRVVLAFIVGIITGQFVNWLNYRWRMKKNPGTVVRRSYWEAVIGLTAVVVLVWIMVATQQARNCALTLNTSLQVEINAGKIEREAFQNAVAMQQKLPPEIQSLPNDDPAKKAATKPIEDYYFGEVARAKQMREDNKGAQDAAREACGT